MVKGISSSSSILPVRKQLIHSPQIRGVSFDIFTFKQPLSTVLELIATLCAPEIYFEDSKIYQCHCR